MRIRTILAAAAAPAALAAVLLGTAGQASAATVNGNSGNSGAISAYFWQPNGHALGGPKDMPNNTVDLSGGYLAKVTEKINNADLRGGTIDVQGTIQGGPFTDQPNGGDPTGAYPFLRVYLVGGSTGVTDGAPQGYMGQSWWANANGYDVKSWSYLNGKTNFDVTVHVDSKAGWGNWNGQQSSTDPASAAQFNDAASHAREVGLSFGGGSFFENGVTGQGSITVTSIQAS